MRVIAPRHFYKRSEIRRLPSVLSSFVYEPDSDEETYFSVVPPSDLVIPPSPPSFDESPANTENAFQNAAPLERPAECPGGDDYTSDGTEHDQQFSGSAVEPVSDDEEDKPLSCFKRTDNVCNINRLTNSLQTAEKAQVPSVGTLAEGQLKDMKYVENSSCSKKHITSPKPSEKEEAVPPNEKKAGTMSSPFKNIPTADSSKPITSVFEGKKGNSKTNSLKPSTKVQVPQTVKSDSLMESDSDEDVPIAHLKLQTSPLKDVTSLRQSIDNCLSTNCSLPEIKTTVQCDRKHEKSSPKKISSISLKTSEKIQVPLKTNKEARKERMSAGGDCVGPSEAVTGVENTSSPKRHITSLNQSEKEEVPHKKKKSSSKSSPSKNKPMADGGKPTKSEFQGKKRNSKTSSNSLKLFANVQAAQALNPDSLMESDSDEDVPIARLKPQTSPLKDVTSLRQSIDNCLSTNCSLPEIKTTVQCDRKHEKSSPKKISSISLKTSEKIQVPLKTNKEARKEGMSAGGDCVGPSEAVTGVENTSSPKRHITSLNQSEKEEVPHKKKKSSSKSSSPSKNKPMADGGKPTKFEFQGKKRNLIRVQAAHSLKSVSLQKSEATKHLVLETVSEQAPFMDQELQVSQQRNIGGNLALRSDTTTEDISSESWSTEIPQPNNGCLQESNRSIQRDEEHENFSSKKVMKPSEKVQVPSNIKEVGKNTHLRTGLKPVVCGEQQASPKQRHISLEPRKQQAPAKKKTVTQKSPLTLRKTVTLSGAARKINKELFPKCISEPIPLQDVTESNFSDDFGIGINVNDNEMEARNSSHTQDKQDGAIAKKKSATQKSPLSLKKTVRIISGAARNINKELFPERNSEPIPLQDETESNFLDDFVNDDAMQAGNSSRTQNKQDTEPSGKTHRRSSQRSTFNKPVYVEDSESDGDFGGETSDEDFDITMLPGFKPEDSDHGSESSDEEIELSRLKENIQASRMKSKNSRTHTQRSSSKAASKVKKQIDSSSNAQPAEQDDPDDPNDNAVDYDWQDGDIDTTERTCPEFDGPDHILEPIEYFRYYWDDELFDYLVEQTNLYSVFRDGKSLQVTRKEMETFIGIWIYMGICRLPSYTDYWGGLTRVPQVADLMPLKRFEKIRARFHLYDSAAAQEHVPEGERDRLAKVRPLLEHVRRKCQGLEQRENKFSIDESIVLYKGRKAGSLRQYMPKKPHKWGFKFFLLCGVSGMAHDFLPYLGADTFKGLALSDEEKSLGKGGQIVTTLCKSIALPRLSMVCFDNYFTSISLLRYLKDNFGLLAIGTVRSNRTSKCPLLSDKELLKKGRGSVDVKVLDDNLACVKWADNKVVTLASTMAGVGQKTVVKRWKKEEREKIDVECPEVVMKYNSMMGGVDNFDMLVELYRTSTRARRWYLPIIGFMISLTLVNGWLSLKQDCSALGEDLEIANSKLFRLHVFHALVTSEKRRGRPPASEPKARKTIKSPVVARPVAGERKDNVDHWPGFSEKRQRCRNCSDGFTEVICLKCNMALCFRKSKNCFVQFHREP